MGEAQEGFLPPMLVSLLGLAARPLPRPLLDGGLARAARTMTSCHPRLVDRLEALRGRTVVIEPSDIPFRFALGLGPGGLTARIADEAEEGAALVRGRLATLIELLEGRLDGDALFFSRELEVEGDVEAVVALRNAADGERVRVLDDLLSPLGPLAAPARATLAGAGALAARVERGLGRLAAAVLAPLERRVEGQRGDLRRLEDRVAALEEAARGRRPVARRAESA